MANKNIKILIVDDTAVNIKVIEMFLKPRGYDVITAEDGQIAIDKFIAESPDVILMDVMMPNVDGYEATIKIRELAGDTWVPIIFLSAKANPEDQVKGIEIGGDDYLTKPVNLSLLEAKLGAMIRIVDMQKELSSTYAALQGYFDQAEQELELAKKLMQNMTGSSEASFDDSIHIYSNALEDINGDITISYRTKNGDLYLLMADATGHGLAAAISQIPLTQIFYQMAEEGYSISSIASKINQTLKKLLPSDRFVTATIILVSTEKQFIEIWNGSNPTPIFFNENGEIVHTFERTNFALGIVDSDVLDTKTEVYVWPEKGELLMFTDGIVDLQNEQDAMFGVSGIIDAMSKMKGIDRSKQIGFDLVIDEAEIFVRDGKRGDDISLISIECN